MNANYEQLTQIEEIGERIAQSIIAFFNADENIEMLNKLIACGLQFEIEEASLSSNILDGKSIVISGTFEKYSREELKKLIETNGGKNASSVSKNTNFLLAGENMGPAKLEKVKKLGVPIISENEFLKMIGLL
jgi:DNA ligase (NAD+)